MKRHIYFKTIKILNRIIKTLIFLILIVVFTIIILNTTSYAGANPAFVQTTSQAFEKIQKYIVRIATPISAVSLGVGLLMRKFSFGEEERIRTAKKVIRGTLISYALILSVDLILELVKTILRWLKKTRLF